MLRFGLFLCGLAAFGQPIQILAVTSAASYEAGLPANGSIALVFCTGVQVSGTVVAPGAPLPTSLAGVSVQVGGTQAPIFAVADLGGYQQINFQVPQQGQVSVSQGSSTASLTPLPLSNSPGEFFRLAGSNAGAFQHSRDYSLVTPTNPAHPGETIIGYGTGIPIATVPPVALGQAAPFSPLAIVPLTDPNQARLLREYLVYPLGGGRASFVGLAPGSIGVFQINFTIPVDTTVGDLPVQLEQYWCSDACIFGGEGWYFSKPVVLSIR